MFTMFMHHAIYGKHAIGWVIAFWWGSFDNLPTMSTPFKWSDFAGW